MNIRRCVTAAALLIVLVMALFPSGSSRLASAYPITPDGSAADWILAAPNQYNVGHIARDIDAQGEYIWTDAPGDERTVFTNPNPDPDVDLLEFRLTADDTYLYFLAKMSDITTTHGDGAPMLQIAIDMDGVPYSGQLFLGAFADTQVNPAAAWERLIMTRFGSENPPIVYDASWTIGAGSEVGNLISSDDDLIELYISWAMLGLDGPSTSPLQFSVATFRATVTDEAWEDGGVSDALDCLSNYGDPGLNTNTWLEVGDSILDYYFMVWFEQDGDPYPPLLISEFLPNPPGVDDNAKEWIEIFNNTNGTLNLTNFKVGDEESADGSEGMYRFPDGSSVPSHQARVVAQTGTGFDSLYAFLPDFELLNLSAAGDMINYSLWASGSIALSNSGDQVLILDARDTILDLAAYGPATYPGVTAIAFAGGEQSVERWPVLRDTNDCSLDFRLQGAPNPGIAYFLSNYLPLLIVP